MRKVGMVVAVESEALRQKYGEGYDLNDGRGTRLYQTQKTQLYAIQCGAGEILRHPQPSTLSTAMRSVWSLISGL